MYHQIELNRRKSILIVAVFILVWIGLGYIVGFIAGGVGGGISGAIVGLIVDPAAPAQIVPAAEASSPSGGKFNRYRYVPEKPAPAPAPAKAGEEGKTPDPEDAAKQLVKSVIKRRR